MKVKELLEALADYDQEMEVQVRVTPVDDGDYVGSVNEFFGDYCDVTDERNILVEYGKLTIVADYDDEAD
jgi:hypothetical protein